MNIHKNARTTPHSRRLMVRRVLDEKQPASRVAAEFGISERTVGKWLARWRAGGAPALNDRSSAPGRSPRQLPLDVTAAIERLRRQRLTGSQIARRLGLPLSTGGPALLVAAPAVYAGRVAAVRIECLDRCGITVGDVGHGRVRMAGWQRDKMRRLGTNATPASVYTGVRKMGGLWHPVHDCSSNEAGWRNRTRRTVVRLILLEFLP